MSLLGKPLFEMCWYYVGIAQVALDPSPPPCQTGKRGKEAPQPSWQAPPYTTRKTCPYIQFPLKDALLQHFNMVQGVQGQSHVQETLQICIGLLTM